MNESLRVLQNGNNVKWARGYTIFVVSKHPHFKDKKGKVMGGIKTEALQYFIYKKNDRKVVRL